MLPTEPDVIVIGAGPAGSVAAALLNQAGLNVLVLEKATFPRFSIGESLLPQAMEFIEQAGLMSAVQAGGFRFKNGAAFSRGEETGVFNFEEKYSPGWGTTFQVERANFDKLLADAVADQGVDFRYGFEVAAMTPGKRPQLTVADRQGVEHNVTTGFVLDASGFGRVLPRLLALDAPSDFPVRASIFCHIEDGIDDEAFDRDKILISVHPDYPDIWVWLIPLSDKKCSFGIVGDPQQLALFGEEPALVLENIKSNMVPLDRLLRKARLLFPPRKISGYAANVRALHGEGFALLGNAGEFLDPVFSSGVTIAMKSASLAADVLMRQSRGETVDWDHEYAKPLKQGVDTFRCYVEAWYDGRFQDVIFSRQQNDDIKRMICSILAGYAWDMDNPYVQDCKRKLNVLAQVCRPD